MKSIIYTLNDILYQKNWHKFLKVPFLTKASVHYLFFSPNDNPSKAMKNDFYSIEKALFLFEVLKYLCLLPFFTLSRFRRTNEKETVRDVMNWLT